MKAFPSLGPQTNSGLAKGTGAATVVEGWSGGVGWVVELTVEAVEAELEPANEVAGWLMTASAALDGGLV